MISPTKREKDLVWAGRTLEYQMFLRRPKRLPFRPTFQIQRIIVVILAKARSLFMELLVLGEKKNVRITSAEFMEL
jgi:hypothetical protein